MRKVWWGVLAFVIVVVGIGAMGANSQAAKDRECRELWSRTADPHIKIQYESRCT